MIYLFVYQLKEVFISASSDLSYSLLLFFRTFRTFRVKFWFVFLHAVMVEPTSSLFPQRVFLRCVKSINCRAVYKRGSLVLLLSYPYKGKSQTKMLKQGSFNASQLVNVQFTSVRFIGCQSILSRRTSIACRNRTDVRAHEMHTLLCWVGIEWVVISNCNVEALNSGKKQELMLTGVVLKLKQFYFKKV